MTIPTMMNNISMEQHRSALKKQYSALTQAVNTLQAQNGAIDNSSIDNLITDLSTQMSISKKGTYGSLTSQPAAFNYTCYKNSSGTCGDLLKRPGINAHQGFITNDGAMYLVLSYSSTCAASNYHTKIDSTETLPLTNMCTSIYIDTNGDKKPNQLGVDMQAIAILKKNNVYYVRPFGANNADDCTSTLPDNYNGSLHCANRMLLDLNMP